MANSKNLYCFSNLGITESINKLKRLFTEINKKFLEHNPSSHVYYSIFYYIVFYSLIAGGFVFAM